MARVVIPGSDSILIVGEEVLISGLVDDVPVTVRCARADLAALGTRAEKIAYVVKLLKAAAPPVPTPVDLAGTYTA